MDLRQDRDGFGDREPLTVLFSLSMTSREKSLLVWMAQESGATMRGLLRKLIRDAASRTLIEPEAKGIRNADAQR